MSDKLKLDPFTNTLEIVRQLLISSIIFYSTSLTQDQRQRERDLRDRHRQDAARMRKRERRLEDEDMRLVSHRAHREDEEEELRVIVR